MRVLIHVHVFYDSLIGEIVDCVRNVESVCGIGNVTTWVTYPIDHADRLEGLCHESFPRARFLGLPNAGYDIGPFFEVLAREDLLAYDIVVKLHTKRDSLPMWINFRNLEGPRWRRALLSFCSSRKAAARTIGMLSKHPNVGMVAGLGVIDINGCAVDLGRGRIERELCRIGATGNAPMRVWGSMFAVRSSILQRLDAHSIGDFITITEANAHKDYGLANLYEELIPALVQGMGFLISTGRFPLPLERSCLFVMRPVYAVVHATVACGRRFLNGRVKHKI